MNVFGRREQSCTVYVVLKCLLHVELSVCRPFPPRGCSRSGRQPFRPVSQASFFTVYVQIGIARMLPLAPPGNIFSEHDQILNTWSVRRN